MFSRSLIHDLQREEEDSNVYSTPNKDWPIGNTYTEGESISIEVVVNAYHWVSTKRQG